MSRVKRAVHARKRKNAYFKAAKGYRGGRSRLLRTVKNAVDRARQYSYRDRKVKKREFRKLWIIRLNAAVRNYGLTYSQFIHGLNLSNIGINRKVLADVAFHDEKTFSSIIIEVKKHLPH